MSKNDSYTTSFIARAHIHLHISGFIIADKLFRYGKKSKNVFQQTWICARVGDRDCGCWLLKTSRREPASRRKTPFHLVEIRRLRRAFRFRRRVQAGRRGLASARRRLEAQGR